MSQLHSKAVPSTAKGSSMENNNVSWKKFVLIIIFSILFSYVVQDAIRLVIFKFQGISPDSYGIANWGNTFFLRILASIIGTSAGTFIIGTFLKDKAKLAAIIAVAPTILLWIATLYFGFQMAQKHDFTFENIKMMLILPGSLAILTPIVALYSVKIGMESSDSFEREKSILNIKWFHWFWILPLYLSKAIAVPLFCLILLWRVDFLYDKSGAYPSIFDLISNWSYYLTRVLILFIFIALVASVGHVYSLLTEESESNKVKTGSIVFGYVLLFSVIHALLFYNLI